MESEILANLKQTLKPKQQFNRHGIRIIQPRKRKEHNSDSQSK